MVENPNVRHGTAAAGNRTGEGGKKEYYGRDGQVPGKKGRVRIGLRGVWPYCRRLWLKYLSIPHTVRNFCSRPRTGHLLVLKYTRTRPTTPYGGSAGPINDGGGLIIARAITFRSTLRVPPREARNMDGR